MDIVVKEAIVDELTFLVNGGQPEMLDSGICYLIHNVILKECRGEFPFFQECEEEWIALYEAAIREWSKWSGSFSYPIPMSAEYHTRQDAARAFDEVRNKWDRATDYGALRLELVQVLLDAMIDSGTTNDRIHSITSAN